MLNIIFGDVEKCIYNTEVYFRNTYEDDWITSDIAKQIIKDVDKSEVLSANCIESSVLGQITPEILSGGTKTLLLLINCSEQVFNASTCGDNCAKWILKIAEEKDITIRLGHIMKFDEPFKIRVVNSNKTVSSMEELIIQAHEYN
ncbi:MAG: DUF4869 domain-containing protein [Lachnospiraceae bacterium]|nr:DUF4869 domain-containing protein [Lachnospiraceae bacterium]